MVTASQAQPQQKQQPLSSEELTSRGIQRSAVEAVVWGMPAVNFERMLEAVIANGGAANQMLYWSRPVNWKDRSAALVYLFRVYQWTMLRAARRRAVRRQRIIRMSVVLPTSLRQPAREHGILVASPIPEPASRINRQACTAPRPCATSGVGCTPISRLHYDENFRCWSWAMFPKVPCDRPRFAAT
jgi:hypothetical protein